MPIVLSHDRKEEIYRFIKKAFSDFLYFEERLTCHVRKMIDHATREDFDSRFMSDLMEECFGRHYLVECNSSKEKKDIYHTMKIILHATVIYLFSLNPIVQDRLFTTIDELVTAYPAFQQQLCPMDRPEHQKELQYLLIFRNFMATALLLLPAKENKIFLLRVIERLEGSNEQYITGTGQKPSTTRRCDIFHQESGTTMIKKRPRKPKEVVSNHPTIVSRETSIISSDSSATVTMASTPKVATKRTSRKKATKRTMSEMEESIVVTASKSQKVTAESLPRTVVTPHEHSECTSTVSPRLNHTFDSLTNSNPPNNALEPTIYDSDINLFMPSKSTEITTENAYLYPLDSCLEFNTEHNKEYKDDMNDDALSCITDHSYIKVNTLATTTATTASISHATTLSRATTNPIIFSTIPYYHSSFQKTTTTTSLSPTLPLSMSAPGSSIDESSSATLTPPMSLLDREINLLLTESYQGSFTEDIEKCIILYP